MRTDAREDRTNQGIIQLVVVGRKKVLLEVVVGTDDDAGYKLKDSFEKRLVYSRQ